MGLPITSFWRGVLAVLHISLFGGFEARLESGEPVVLKGRKSQALVAYMALRPGKPFSRQELVALLWGDRGEPQARSSLRQSLSEFRKALGKADCSPLVSGRDSVLFEADAVNVDVAEFERLIDEGTPTALERAAELYRGDLLDGIGVHDSAFEDWLRDESQRLNNRACEALSKLLDHQAGEDSESAIATARQLLALDPLREATHRALIRLYAGKGERAMALRQYQACREVLAAELEISPEPETEQLAAEIRTAAAGTDEAVDPEPNLRVPGVEALPPPDKPSIAVLPFVNVSGDAEQEYFSDGITEDIITELTRFPTLFVIARNSSFTYKGRAMDVRTIGQELGVRYVVEGSVRKAGNRVRITAQLVEAESGNHLWAERYDQELEDIFAVQDEVVHEIAAAVPGRLDAIAAQRARRRPVKNLTAYDYVLRGEWHFGQEYAARDAVPLFEKAIEIDPQCARAYTWLANFHAYSIFRDGAPFDEAAKMARSLAERALQIDPSDPAVQATAAQAYYMAGELDLARRHIERAIKLNPNDYVVMEFAGYVLAYLGDHQEGLSWLHRLSQHDPALFSVNASREGFFDLYYMARRYEDAIEAMRGWRNPPCHMYLELAAAFAQLDRIDDVRTTMAQFERIRPEGYDAVKVAYSQARTCARQEDADHWLEGYRKAGLDV
jgi:TolB-like protein/regulator of sirC expression with transglutaminase-like and TPR domain